MSFFLYVLFCFVSLLSYWDALHHLTLSLEGRTILRMLVCGQGKEREGGSSGLAESNIASSIVFVKVTSHLGQGLSHGCQQLPGFQRKCICSRIQLSGSYDRRKTSKACSLGVLKFANSTLDFKEIWRFSKERMQSLE